MLGGVLASPKRGSDFACSTRRAIMASWRMDREVDSGYCPDRTHRTFMIKNFAQFATWFAVASGHPIVFAVAVATVIVWLLTGPFFSYSDSWQLVMNTWTSVVSF